MQFDSDISTLVQARHVRIAIAWKKGFDLPAKSLSFKFE